VSKTCELEHHASGCGCEGGAQDGEPTTCGGNITIPTLEEQHILARIRQVQEEAHSLKQSIAALEQTPDGSPSELNALRDRLQALRQQRAALEDQRVMASEERMRLLGHA
jgi:chromosome segregation ATPase